MLSCIPTFCVLLITFTSLEVQCAVCPDGWFGAECKFLCHCSESEKCGAKGQCPANERCSRGYFGPACQYVDIVWWDAIDTVEPFIRDSDDTTCNPHKFQTSVEILLKREWPFTWIRIIVNNKNYLLNFTTSLNNDRPCSVERKFVANNVTVDFTCAVNFQLSKLHLEGAVVGSICSVYISAGWNLALIGDPDQSTTNGPLGTATNAIDGDRNPDYDSGHCSHTMNEDEPTYWSLEYKRPVRLYAARIYNTDKNPALLAGFTVETLDYDNATTWTNNFTDSSSIPLEVYDIIMSSQMSVKIFQITQEGWTPLIGNALVLCEVETYGDVVCQENTYGFLCEGQCDCKKTEVCHPSTGVCGQACPQGFYGSNCSLACSLTCLYGACEYLSGNCLQCIPGYLGPVCNKICLPGNFGQDCLLNCSDICIDICNHDDGLCTCENGLRGPHCTDCANGMYGENCTDHCSKYCDNGKCDKLTGNCLSCVGHRVGLQCEDCPERFYGSLCILPCSEHCFNFTCDQVSGKCPVCDNDFYGDSCQYATNNMYYWLLLMPAFQICLVIFLCWLEHSERDEDDDGTE